jgi:ATP-binding cassette, subfamily G (WHITE), member 2, SNQ2
MYWVVPYTYVMEGLVGQCMSFVVEFLCIILRTMHDSVIGNQGITCANTEYVNVNPPSGQTCAQYLGSYITRSGGYITNPNATTSCQYCAFSTTDQWMTTIYSMYYSHRWRDVGVYAGYAVLNVSCVYHMSSGH